MGALQDVVKAIALNSKRDESRDFATYVQREMLESLRSVEQDDQGPGREAGAVRRADRRRRCRACSRRFRSSPTRRKRSC